MSEKRYKQVRDHSFRVAYFMLKCLNDAEDIAQIVSIKFLLNEEKINNPLTWSSIVAKNEVIKLSKAKHIFINLGNNELDFFIDKSTEIENDKNLFNMNLTSNEVRQLLSNSDYRVYHNYISCNLKTSLFAKRNKLSYYSASTKIYKMKRNLKAAFLLSQEWKGTKEIVNYYMNQKIVYFINMFISKMKSNDLSSLHKYFEFMDQKQIPQIDMKEKIDYEIKLLKKNVYCLVLAYRTSNRKIGYCIFTFYLDNRKRIRIVNFKEKPEEVIVLKMSKEEFLKKSPKKVKGIIPNNFEDVKKIFNK